jgi:hypothetical protein
LPAEYADLVNSIDDLDIDDIRDNWEDQFIIRRDFIMENGIYAFIVKYFTDSKGNNVTFDRFFKNVPKHMIEENIRQMIYRWIGEGHQFSFDILPDYLYNQLFRREYQLHIYGLL